MFTNLISKVMTVTENYTDLVGAHIIETQLKKDNGAPNSEINSEANNEIKEIGNNIRMLHQAISSLERLNRMNQPNGSCDLNEL